MPVERERFLLVKGLMLIGVLLLTVAYSTFQLTALSSLGHLLSGGPSASAALTGVNVLKTNVKRSNVEMPARGESGTAALKGGVVAGSFVHAIRDIDRAGEEKRQVGSSTNIPFSVSSSLTSPAYSSSSSSSSLSTSSLSLSTSSSSSPDFGSDSLLDSVPDYDIVDQTTSADNATSYSPTTALPTTNDATTAPNASSSSTTPVTTAAPTSPTETTAPPTTPTTAPPTTPTTEPPLPCFQKPYMLRDACDMSAYINGSFGENVTIEDVSHMLFVQTVIDRLKGICPVGSWCLDKDWSISTDDNDFLLLCEVGDCLLSSIPDECLDDERRLVLSTLLLLCDVHSTNLTSTCRVSIRKMTHVAMTTLQQQKEGLDVCDTREEYNTCSGACNQLAQGLYCMSETCDQQHTELLTEYVQWQWFFRENNRRTWNDTLEMCGLDNGTYCLKFIFTDSSWLSGLINEISSIREMDMSDHPGLVAGVFIASLLVLTAFIFAAVCCVRRSKEILGYSRNKVGYSALDDEEQFHD